MSEGVSTARFAPSIVTPSVRLGLGPAALIINPAVGSRETSHYAEGVTTARFAPSITTPSVRLGLGPAALLADWIFRRKQVPSIRLSFSPAAMLIHCVIGGGSKPPPYGWADRSRRSADRAHRSDASRESKPLCGGSNYCSLLSQHHDPLRTAGPWSSRYVGR